MITNLKIRNFKALQEADVPLRPLSLFTGLNGMGKSTLMQAILMLRQSYQQQSLQNQGLILNGELTQIGTASDALSEGAPEDFLEIEVTLDQDRVFGWEFDCRISQADVLALTGIRSESYTAMARDREQHRPFGGDSVLNFMEWKLPFMRGTFQYLSAERAAPQAAYPTSTFEVVQERSLGNQGQYTAHYLAAFGDEPVPYENLLYPSAAGADPVPNTLRQQVSAWLGDISPGLRISATEHPDFGLARVGYEFQTTTGYTRAFRPTNVGFGLSYILPVLTAILSTTARPPKHGMGTPLLLIENPETHLHPRGQSRLGELLALAAQNDVQLFVETHSDHVLNGIRVAVKKYQLDPTRVGLNFFERAPAGAGGHQSVIIQPQLDEDGRIDFWPRNFFDEWSRNLRELL